MSTTSLDNQSKAVSEAAGSAKALVKGLALVEIVATAPAGSARLGELVEASVLPRPTVLRLLDALLAAGVLQAGTHGEYRLGPQLAVWGQRYLDRLDLVGHAEDVLRRLVEQTRETSFLGVADRRHVLYVAKADGPQAVRPAAQVGGRNPLHSTGMGKALLAHADPETVRAYVAEPLVAKTPNTITDPDRLLADLAEVRTRGYAIDDVENEDGVRCVAAPILGHAGRVVAALSLSAPAYRFALADLARLAPLVTGAAAEISGWLGHRTEAPAEPPAEAPAEPPAEAPAEPSAEAPATSSAGGTGGGGA